MKAKTLNATEFKAKCLRILDQLEPQGIIVTKRGQPIAKITPIRRSRFDQLYGCMKGKIKIKGDIFSTGIRWNAQSGKVSSRRFPSSRATAKC
jgi:antitoxin (DNA-binding transcriptional repressor) of toxin-antitoxin stability system